MHAGINTCASSGLNSNLLADWMEKDKHLPEAQDGIMPNLQIFLAKRSRETRKNHGFVSNSNTSLHYWHKGQVWNSFQNT